jgi:PAS domain S-box-containing protein
VPLVEEKIVRLDGGTVDVEVLAAPFAFRGTNAIHVILRDITERKRAEEKIIQAKNDWESTFGAVTDMITVHDLDFNIVRTNPAAQAILELPLQEAIPAAKCFRCYHGAETPPPECPSCQTLQTGLPSAVEMFEPYLGKYLEIRSMPRFGIDNHLIGLIHIVRDVTERKRAEAERERLMAAIEQAGEIVLITDREGTIQYVNPAFETVTGYTREEAVGQNPRILKSGRQDEAFYGELWKTISSGQTWEGRIVNKRKDGTLYTETATISPVRDAAGRIVSFVAVKRDITEHLNMEEQFQQAQKLESVGRLAGGVAHDFNNMLGVILGYAEIAMYEAGPGTPLYGKLIEIRNAAHRSADLTRQLLAFARKQTIDAKVLDLNETIEGMLKMLRRLIGEDIDLVWMRGAGLWPVKMDPAQIDQILANLCVNARDAIAGVGKVTIQTKNAILDEAYCAAHAGFAPGEFVMLAVSDNGCGMDEETRRRLFEPFFTTKEVGKGTGLGLSTVYGIVKQNDGFINVYSEPGQGTTFKIYIPRHAGNIVETSAARVAELRQGHGETVLLVEDEPAVLDMGKGMLEKLGYTVLTADAPRDALRLAEEHTGKIDLVMTDVVMPEMNGRELAERLLEIKPGMKCLFMSGYTANVIAHHGALDEGVQFIQKPFSMKSLAAKVGEVLDQK